MPIEFNPPTVSDWAIRDEHADTQTGFGSNGELALAAFNRLVEKAKESDGGGEFSLIRDGREVSRAFVPARKGER